jgi:hypothetical protein
METSIIWEKHPRLYHMAAADSLRSIMKHGLLSTSALLDLFEYSGKKRVAIEACHRPESIQIVHRSHGTAMIRDQKPMSDKGLQKCLEGMSVEAWYRLLNSKVFFWLSEARLRRMLHARPYRQIHHCVLIIDTKSLLTEHEDNIYLSPMNSGCTKPYPHERGRTTFRKIKDYSYDFWRKRRGNSGDTIVELAVAGRVPDIMSHVIRVERRKDDTIIEKIWER